MSPPGHIACVISGTAGFLVIREPPLARLSLAPALQSSTFAVILDKGSPDQVCGELCVAKSSGLLLVVILMALRWSMAQLATPFSLAFFHVASRA